MTPRDSDIIGLTLELSRLIRRKMNVRAAKGGLNVIRLHGLTFIRENDGVTMTHFARLMNISPSSATAFADRLAAEGLVKRVHAHGNRKTVQLRLTAKGEAALRASQLEKAKVLSAILRVLPAGDKRQFGRILTAILSAHSSA